ncbi:MAG: phosphate ABC transporter permease PstA [Actinomycetes bacterium]
MTNLEASAVTPLTPWKATLNQRLFTVLLLAVAIALSYVVVAVTPMKGKLAYAFLFMLFSVGFQATHAGIKRGRTAAVDAIAGSIAVAGAVLVFTPVISLIFTTIIRGSKGLRVNTFTQTMEHAAMTDPISQGGLLHSLIGTLYLILIATVISLPLALLTALYLTEIKGRAAGFIQFLVQAMSGVPSIVAGVFIYAALLLTTSLHGSTIMGALPLAILMIPTVTRTAQEVLLLVPQDLREAGVALGATQWKTVATIVVPAARSGLITAVILGIARIAGETAPLLFTLGVSDKINWNPLNGGQSALPYYVWSGLGLGSPEAIQRAWTGILVLLMIVLVLFTAARILGREKK